MWEYRPEKRYYIKGKRAVGVSCQHFSIKDPVDWYSKWIYGSESKPSGRPGKKGADTTYHVTWVSTSGIISTTAEARRAAYQKYAAFGPDINLWPSGSGAGIRGSRVWSHSILALPWRWFSKYQVGWRQRRVRKNLSANRRLWSGPS